MAANANAAAVWCGDQTTMGDGAATTADRYSSLASVELGLTEVNAAKRGAGFAVTGNDLTMQIDAAAGSVDPNTVGHVFLMAGLLDPYERIADLQRLTAATIAHAGKTFPHARIVVGCGPGCIDTDDDAAIERQGHVLTAIRLAGENADALTIADLRAVCGSDPRLHASGVSPNDEGHALLADAVETAVRADEGEPVDAPITPERIYTSGLHDFATMMVRDTRRREAEKREANRPTGTELAGLTGKLDELTRAQGLQQVILEHQQTLLEAQQEQLKAQQNQLQAQQEQLKNQQDALSDQQKQLKAQQETLAQQQATLSDVVKQLGGVVDSQGQTVTDLQNITKQLQDQSTSMQQWRDNTNKVLRYCVIQFGAIHGALPDYEPGTPPTLEG